MIIMMMLIMMIMTIIVMILVVYLKTHKAKLKHELVTCSNGLF